MAYVDLEKLKDRNLTAKEVSKIFKDGVEEANRHFYLWLNTLSSVSRIALAGRLQIGTDLMSHMAQGRRGFSAKYMEALCSYEIEHGFSAHELIVGEVKGVRLTLEPETLMNMVYPLSDIEKATLAGALKDKYKTELRAYRPPLQTETFNAMFQSRIREYAEMEGKSTERILMDSALEGDFTYPYADKNGTTHSINTTLASSLTSPVRLATVLRISIIHNISADFLCCQDYTATANWLEYIQYSSIKDKPTKIRITDSNMKEILSVWLKLPRDKQISMVSDVFRWCSKNNLYSVHPKRVAGRNYATA